MEGIVLFWDDKAYSEADIHGSLVDGRTEQLAYAFQAIDNRLLMGYGGDMFAIMEALILGYWGMKVSFWKNL